MSCFNAWTIHFLLASLVFFLELRSSSLPPRTSPLTLSFSLLQNYIFYSFFLTRTNKLFSTWISLFFGFSLSLYSSFHLCLSFVLPFLWLFSSLSLSFYLFFNFARMFFFLYLYLYLSFSFPLCLCLWLSISLSLSLDFSLSLSFSDLIFFLLSFHSLCSFLLSFFYQFLLLSIFLYYALILSTLYFPLTVCLCVRERKTER